jgi:hypothetical protein
VIFLQTSDVLFIRYFLKEEEKNIKKGIQTGLLSNETIMLGTLCGVFQLNPHIWRIRKETRA